MKFIKAFARFLFIFFIWSSGYFIWFQKLMFGIWKFDPFASKHWRYIWMLWQRGWVIRQPGEWMFVILLFAFIPLWIIGLALLSSVSWTSLIKNIFLFPFRLLKRKKASNKTNAKIKVTRKKSYKKIRPPAIRPATGKIKAIEKEPPAQEAPAQPAPVVSPAPAPASATPSVAATPLPASSPVPKSSAIPSPASYSTPAPSSAVSGNSVADILKSAGYKLLQNITVGSQKIDYVGVSATKLLLCLVDAERGDWLADEERFNDEEPLWFSESNHRVSPVRLVLNAKEALPAKLSGRAHDLTIEPMVVISQGTIINAEDMLDVWNNLHINVCRFASGAPTDIKLLNEALSPVTGPDESLYTEIASMLR